MTTMRLSPIFLSLALAAAACGGSGDPGPQPLSQHFQDSYIAQVSVDEQGEMLEAQSKFNLAQREQMKADADHREAKKTLVDVADNEVKAAKLDESSAKLRADAAKSSADQNRIAQTATELQAAQLARGAAEARLAYYRAYHDWLKALVRYTAENTYWRESQWELAKARLAQKHNIAPSGFNYDNYVSQEATRNKRVETWRSRADDAKAKAGNQRGRWQALQGEADKVLGKKSEFPDPMSQKPGGTDPAAGSGGMTIGGGGGAASDGQVPTADDPAKTVPEGGQ
jgi:hypothetical protein